MVTTYSLQHQSLFCVWVCVLVTGGVPMYNIPSVVFPVARFFLEDVLQMTRFVHMTVEHC